MSDMRSRIPHRKSQIPHRKSPIPKPTMNNPTPNNADAKLGCAILLFAATCVFLAGFVAGVLVALFI